MKSLIKTALSLAALALMLPSSPSVAESVGKMENFGKAEDFSAAVSDKELDNSRGRFGSQSLMFSNLSATLEGNTATNSTSGANSINDSFNSVAGLTTVIQNSGNNVIIQQSTMVNVNIQ